MTNTEYDETAIAEMGKASERSSTKVSWLIPDLSRAASPGTGTWRGVGGEDQGSI